MRSSQIYQIFSGQNANGIGDDVYCRDHRTANLHLNTTGGTNFTIKVQVSQQESLPDFSAPATATNQWSYAQLINLTDGSAVNGNTGLPLSSDVAGNQYEINTNGQVWMNAIISSYVAGVANLSITLFDNQ